jgi:crotonobetainyl-CoA:carnitine CoA-transferase CaiB-like acyl-CoA transferase
MLGRPWRDSRRATVPGIADVKDGLVDVGCGTAQQWFDLCAMVGHQEWIDEDSPLSITEQAGEKADEIYAWFQSRTVAEILDLASTFQILNASVANGASITGLEYFAQRQSFVTNPRDGSCQPAHPYRMRPAQLRPPQPAPRLGEHTVLYRRSPLPARRPTAISGNAERLPLDGIRVLDSGGSARRSFRR